MGNGSSLTTTDVEELNSQSSAVTREKPKIIQNDSARPRVRPQPKVVRFDESSSTISSKGSPREPPVATNKASPDPEWFSKLNKAKGEEAIALVEPIISWAKQLKSVEDGNNKLGRSLEFLAGLYDDETDKRGPQVSAALDNAGLTELTSNAWTWLTKKKHFMEKIPTEYERNEEFKLFENLWALLLFTSNFTPSVCKKMVDHGVLDIYLAFIKHNSMVNAQELLKKEQTEYLLGILFISTSAVHNCLRNNRIPSQRRLRDGGCVEALEPYIKVNEEEMKKKGSSLAQLFSVLKLWAIIIAAYLVDEDQVEMLDTGADLMDGMGRLLSPVDEDTRTLFKSIGFGKDAILEALNALAKHDANKVRMADQGLVPIVMNCVRNPDDDGVLLHSTKALCTLTFEPKCVAAAKEADPEYRELLSKLIKHENKKIGKAAAVSLWNIDGQLSDEQKEAVVVTSDEHGVDTTGAVADQNRAVAGDESANKQPSTNHVMISYDHDHKHVGHRFKTVVLRFLLILVRNFIHVHLKADFENIVRKLNAELEQRGYETWIDVKEMRGLTLAAIYDAIENAAVILLCYSERYYQSDYCRKEAIQASQLQKPIVPVRTEAYKARGWLSMVLENRLYTDVHSVEQVPLKVDAICRQLGDLGKSGAALPGAVSHQKPARQPARKSTGKPLEEWTNEEVQKWLLKQDLSKISPKMSESHLSQPAYYPSTFDGAGMAELRTMYQNSPTLFFKNARKFLGIFDLASLLRMMQKLNKLD